MYKEWNYYKLKLTSQNNSIDEECSFDLMTWKRFFSLALQKYHGLFGQGIEYHVLNQDNQIAYIKVSYFDKDTFASAVTAYISNEDLYEHPLVTLIEQETDDINKLQIGKDDSLWWKKECEEVEENA